METINVLIAVTSAFVGIVGASIAFAVYLYKMDKRVRRAEYIARWSLKRTGSIYDKLGMKERFVDDIERLMLAMETPTSSEAIRQ
jgi:hypothetical protein